MQDYGQNWSEQIFNEIRNDFVHSGCDVYFVPGIARILYDELDYDSDDEDTAKIQQLRQLVRFITTAHKEQFSRNLEHITTVQDGPNKGQKVKSAPFSFEDLYSMFSKEQEKVTNAERAAYETTSQNSTKYTVIELKDFETAHKYLKYTDLPHGDAWCYLENKATFDSYRASGNKLYLALAPGFEKLKPGDKGYGRSMIGFDMGPADENGRSTMEVCNNRYNHATDLEHENDKTGDNKYNEIELSKILGVPIWSTYSGYTQDELLDQGIISSSMIQQAVKAITPEQYKALLADEEHVTTTQYANTLYIAIESVALLNVIKDNKVFTGLLKNQYLHEQYTLHVFTDTKYNVITAFATPVKVASRHLDIECVNNCVLINTLDYTEDYKHYHDIILPDCTLFSAKLQRTQSITNINVLSSNLIFVTVFDSANTTYENSLLNTTTGDIELNNITLHAKSNLSYMYELFSTKDNTLYIFEADNTADDEGERSKTLKLYSSFKPNIALLKPNIIESTTKYAYIVATDKNTNFNVLYSLHGKLLLSSELKLTKIDDVYSTDILYLTSSTQKMISTFANPTKFIVQVDNDMLLSLISWYSKYYDKEVDAMYGSLNIVISELPDKKYKINVFSVKLQKYIFDDIISTEAYIINSYDNNKNMYFFRIFLESSDAALTFMNSSYGMMPCLVKLKSDIELSDDVIEWAKLPEELEAEQNETQQN